MPKLAVEVAAWAEALWHRGDKYPNARGGTGEGSRDPRGGDVTTPGISLSSPKMSSTPQGMFSPSSQGSLSPPLGSPSLPAPTMHALCTPPPPCPSPDVPSYSRPPPHTPRSGAGDRAKAAVSVPIHGPRLIHLSAGPGGQTLWVSSGPPSVTVNVGEEARLQCLYNSSRRDCTVKWWRVLQGNYTWPPQYQGLGKGPSSELTFPSAMKNDSGLYLCEVTENTTATTVKVRRSCGTYLRVRGECRSWLQGPTTPHPRSLLAHTDPFLLCAVGTSMGPCLGAGLGPGGHRALNSTPSSQSRPPGPSWTWGRALRTTSSQPRGSSCCSALWCPGHCCCSG